MIIRPYRPTDARHLAAILHKAVHAIGARDYSAAQLDAWSPAPIAAERFHARVSDGRAVTVAVSNEDVPVAFIELEADGHIDCFYCHPDVAGSGVGRALFGHAQSQALTAGVKRLTVEASEAARRFFLREGFHVMARREFQLLGVSIHNYAMEKRLDLIHA
ncbi:GNAT family N-acetyltransferase [Dinoroseobacter sp. PD6]|uniref:GNAT family N-acetyltransferase n=1 Tax=Dinoroseobacter sp. PD6 TaxID=3028384 RepID=UPI00237A398E|nr:GNAT family N-acetyltransferase [Dinoroseobacter sp. PD6]MDD9718629.1 GNAT family N-acetyltransferase [Dinoroseobacter sp. PD6]